MENNIRPDGEVFQKNNKKAAITGCFFMLIMEKD